MLTSSGELVFTQDKRVGFSLDDDQLERYDLTKKLGKTGPLTERIRKERKVTMVDTSAGRFAVAICEDLGCVVIDGKIYRSGGVTHLLVPVIAPAMWDGGWQRKARESVATVCGVSVAVANSIAIDQQSRTVDDKPSGHPAATLCLVSAPHSGPVRKHGTVTSFLVALDEPLVDPIKDSLTVRESTL